MKEKPEFKSFEKVNGVKWDKNLRKFVQDEEEEKGDIDNKDLILLILALIAFSSLTWVVVQVVKTVLPE